VLSHRSLLSRLFLRLKLAFEDESVERDYRRNRITTGTKVVSFATGFTVLLWGAFGIWDASQTVQGVDQTRFRFMVAVPCLLVFFGLSFTVMARRWQDAFIWAFAVFASALAVKQLQQYGDGPYSLSGGSSALNFALILVFGIGVFPVSVAWSFILGLSVIALYATAVLTSTTVELAIAASYLFNLVCICGVLVFMSYWRERFARQEYIRQIVQDRERDKLSSFLSSYIPLNMVSDGAVGKHEAESFGEVTLLFSDLVGFTTLTEHLAPKHVLEILDTIFTAFDGAAKRHGVEKVKTIGDAYMGIAGKTAVPHNHAKATIDFAFEAISIVQEVAAKTGYPLRVRVGIHTGSTIGGVIGRHDL
jgi:adenylate cyclase